MSRSVVRTIRVGLLSTSLLLLATSTWAQNDPEPVTAGEWTILSTGFHASDDRHTWWRAKAARTGSDEGPTVHLRMRRRNGELTEVDDLLDQVSLGTMFATSVEPVRIDGVGTVQFRSSIGLVESGRFYHPDFPRIPDRFAVFREFTWRLDERTDLKLWTMNWQDEQDRHSSSWGRSRSYSNVEDVPDEIRGAYEDAAKNPERGPTADLIRTLASRDVALASFPILLGEPGWEAAGTGGAFRALEPSTVTGRGVGATAWKLPARPGDRLRVRARPRGVRLTVSTRGIDEDRSPGALAGLHVELDGESRVVGSDGLARFELDVQSPEKLTFTIENKNSLNSRAGGHLVLRWGRSAEAYLERKELHLPALKADATREETIDLLVLHLESHHAPDFGTWRNHGVDYILWLGRSLQWPAVAALQHLDLSATPQLASVRESIAGGPAIVGFWGLDDDHDRPRLYHGNPASHVQRDAFKHAVLRRTQNEFHSLWEPLRIHPYQASKFEIFPNWHTTQLVYVIATAYEIFPDQRDEIPLRRILDFWLEAMRTSADPVMRKEVTPSAPYSPGVMGVVPDLRLESRAYAVAALHRGSVLLGDRRYARARDEQLDRLRHFLEVSGWLLAIRDREAVTGHDEKRRVLASRRMGHAVSVYGQVLDYVGAEAAANDVRDWIRSALTRDGGDEGPFADYRYALLKDRLGMLAVVRGEAAMFLAPPGLTEVPTVINYR